MKLSNTGYRKNSKDKNEPSLIIPSDRISMKDVQQPVYGMGNNGYSKMMYPGEEHLFPGADFVQEIPMMQSGGPTAMINGPTTMIPKTAISPSLPAPKVNKFIKNYDKNCAPQGESMDDVIQRRNVEFVDFIADNARKFLYKENLEHIKKYQNGGPLAYDPTNYQDIDMSGTAAGTPNEKKQAPASNFYTSGPFGLYGNTPGSVPGFNPGTAMPEMKQFVETPSGNAGMSFGESLKVDPQAVDNNMKNGNAQASTFKLPDFADIILGGMRGINSSLRNNEANRQLQIAKNKMTIENVAPHNYGSRGDYDVNSGAFRPDQLTPAFYKKGGSSKQCYKKGGEYEVSRNDLLSLLENGYEFDFVD